MSSPAERYAASRRRAVRQTGELAAFATSLTFELDPFQVEACEAVEAGRGVLVAAPTGAGKTVVGEFAVHLALAKNRKAFYTTPIKALSNQKYLDLVRRHGAANVGLLTGDSSINGEAPVVVMTTEVLRNMMYAGSHTLTDLGFVVMDEVHYLADRFRGPVWEEVIIHLPRDVQVISLSATVSNAEEFGAWLGTVRGDVDVVVEEHRPVPLWQHMMVGRELLDLFVEEGDGGDAAVVINPELLESIRNQQRGDRRPEHRGRLADEGAPKGRRGTPRRGLSSPTAALHVAPGGGGQPGGHRGGPGGGSRPGRAEVITRLDRDGLLPAITFIFSRVGCEAAVTQLLMSGLRLVDDRVGEEIRRIVEGRVSGLAAEDLTVLGYWEFVEGLTRGFAAHHAGMLPTFREIVEELFTAGRIRAVFATETLALGINMPARTVVLEKLVKFNGESHVQVTPAEYTQLTGRAGRRGIDVEGHAVVVWHPTLDPFAVAGLASTRTYPLRSSFRPTYNMAVNLVAGVGREEATKVLETSFAQFQADRSVVGMSTAIRDNEEALSGYSEAMTCHLGDFAEYASLRAQISAAEKASVRERTASRRAETARSLEELRAGDVVWVPGRNGGRAIVVQAARGHAGEAAAPALIGDDARLRRLGPLDVSSPLTPVAFVRIPSGFNLRNAKSRRDLAATMRAKVPDEPPRRARDDDNGDVEELGAEARRGRGGSRGAQGPGRSRGSEGSEGSAAARAGAEARIAALRARLKAHPCHACPDREHHARWAERWHRLERETEALRRKVAGRTSSVARQFVRICEVLVRLGYLEVSRAEGRASTRVTAEGERLRRLYTEKDLLAAQCLRDGVWNHLDPASLAAVVSCLIHEPRGAEPTTAPVMPNDDVLEAHDEMVRRWSSLEDLEAEQGLATTAYPDPGIAWMMHRWASGQRLELVLRDSDMSAGDFVRRCKQTVDLLDQIADAAPQPTLTRTARKAVDAVLRGVVAADRLD